MTDHRDDVRDELPDDLNAHDPELQYEFPDNSRRRIPGDHLSRDRRCVAGAVPRQGARRRVRQRWLPARSGVVRRGRDLLVHVRLADAIDEKQALDAAGQAVGFTVGHASAQQVWRGLRSRPTWRVLCYSADDPPTRRGLVLVDAVDGRVIEHMVEDTPDDDLATWAAD